MNTESFGDPIRLAQRFDSLTRLPSWENDGVTLDGLQKLIDNNQRLFSQTFDERTARQLSDVMSRLSERVSTEFGSSNEGSKLAKNIQFYAKAVFNEGSTSTKTGLLDLPADVIKREILPKVLSPEMPLEEFKDSSIRSTILVAKDLVQPTQETFVKWIEEQDIPLKEFCKTGKEAIDFIIKNNLTKVNLSGFTDIFQEDLLRLAPHCSKITHLEFGQLNNLHDFPFQNLTHLESLTFQKSDIAEPWITGALGHLANLKRLKFIDCKLEGEQFAIAISQLGRLESLTLEKNYMTSEAWMVAALQNPNIKILKFKDMSLGLSESIAQILSKKTSLESLSFDGCHAISDQWLESVCTNLTGLKHIVFYTSGDLSDLLTHNLDDLVINLTRNKPHLESFHCDDFQLTNGHLNLGGVNDLSEDYMARVLENFPNIKGLTLSLRTESMGNRLAKAISSLAHLESVKISTGHIPTDWLAKAFAELTRLKSVEFNVGLIDDLASDTWLNLFRNNPHLVSLSFMDGGMQVINDQVILKNMYGITEDLIIALINAIPKLKTLIIEGLSLRSDESAQAISKHTELETFDGDYHLTSEWLSAALGSLTGLRNIGISCFSDNMEEEVAKIVHNNPRLESLSLIAHSDQGEEPLSKAVQNHEKLVHLTLFKGRQMKIDRLLQILLHLPQLQTLDLSESDPFSFNFDPVEFEESFSKLSELRSLNFKDCMIPEVQLNFILYKLPHSLRDLDLTHNFDLTGEKLIKGLAKHSQLQSLNLQGCEGITFEALKKMLTVLPNLRRLNLLDCKQFSGEQIDKIRGIYPDLEIEFTKENEPKFPLQRRRPSEIEIDLQDEF